MNTVGGRKNKKKAEDGEKVGSKEEEEALRKDAEELKTWIDMIENMNDQELKGYLEDHAEEIKETTTKVQKTKTKETTAKVQKPKTNTKTKVQSNGKSRSATGIMASVWRFHKD